jgi:hypothetical protein
MLGDMIEDIPKLNFFVSEDNYAWDMDERAQAIASNHGVMRNPLSRQMFSELDIRMILAHPLGQRLKPLQMAQSQLKKGVRPATIDRIEKPGRIMLADQGVDAAPGPGGHGRVPSLRGNHPRLGIEDHQLAEDSSQRWIQWTAVRLHHRGVREGC